MASIRKILIIRLSSIGDIVLTSPIVRSLRSCYPEASIHFLTKAQYAPLLEHNPQIDRVHRFAGDMNATVAELRKEGFDKILDLHRNIRSRIIKTRLGISAETYSKDRIPILLYTKFRRGKLPDRHTVDRYAEALRRLGCELDEKSLEIFVPEAVLVEGKKRIEAAFGGEKKPLAVVLGGKWETKKWPTDHFIELLRQVEGPIVLLGGPDEKAEAEQIAKALEGPILNVAGEAGLLESAALMNACDRVLTHDTGFMHIAVALRKRMISIWGSTVPEFGFSPYRAENARILQSESLSCRPCSKIGYKACPKKHFKCMRDISPQMVLDALRELGES